MEAPPAQPEREIKCEFCGRKFHNKANVRRHKRLNRCSVLQQERDQQQMTRQQTPTPTPARQQQLLPQPRAPQQSQQSSQLLSMTHPQRIEWLKECMKNNEQLSQSLVQMVLAIANAGPMPPPAVVSGNNAGNEVGTEAGTSQQLQPLQSQIHRNRIESDEE